MMNRVFLLLLIISLGFNLFFFNRKTQRTKRINDKAALHLYKNISYEEGYKTFENALAAELPDMAGKRYKLVYRWDSLWYDMIFRGQMFDLDSMAAGLRSSGIECVFVTEMEKQPAFNFLRHYNDSFVHARMLFSMDDYISGLHNNQDVKIVKPKTLSRGKRNSTIDNFKQTSLYVLIDPTGKVIYSNENRGRPAADSLLMEKLKPLLTRTKKIQAD